MGELNIGVVTDSHFGGDDALIANCIKVDGLDAVCFLGDAPSSIRSAPVNQFMEIYQSVLVFEDIGVPVFWMAGNYEDYFAYKAVFNRLEDALDNVIDVSRMDRPAHFRGYDLLFIPGASELMRGFHVTSQVDRGEYFLNGSQVYVSNPGSLRGMVSDPKRTVVFSHQPCRMDGSPSIDLAVNAEYAGRVIAGPAAHSLLKRRVARPLMGHVGDAHLRDVLCSIGIDKFISGHIHEGVAISDAAGNPIPEGKYSSQIYANPGPAKEGDYGVLTLRDDGTACFRRYNAFGCKVDYLSSLLGK